MFDRSGFFVLFLLPYFKRLGRDVPAFDFSLEGVSSISVGLTPPDPDTGTGKTGKTLIRGSVWMALVLFPGVAASLIA